MNAWHDIDLGDRIDQHVPVVIEIPKGSKVKYELNKQLFACRSWRVGKEDPTMTIELSTEEVEVLRESLMLWLILGIALILVTAASAGPAGGLRPRSRRRRRTAA